MTEEQTSTSTSNGGASEPGSASTGPDTTTAEPTQTTAGTTDSGSGSSSGSSSGKKSWRGRARASKPDRSAKAGEAAQAGRSEDAGESGDAGASEDAGKGEKKTKTKQPKQKREKQVAEKKRRTPGHGMGVGEIRTLVARIVWVVCLVFALALAITALFIALKANSQNDAVRFIVDFADKVDLGIFDLTNPIKDFDSGEGPSTDTKTALFNYGIGAVVWLVIGRIGDRVIRP